MNKPAQRRVATTVALFLVGFYICWNVWWLSLSRVPPSILVSATGIPSPTTGGTRSVFALASGNWQLSLYHNVATIPIILLLVTTMAFVLRRGQAPRFITRMWCHLLLFAFVAKITTAFAFR